MPDAGKAGFPRLWILLLALLALTGPLSAQEEGLFELRLTALPESRTVAVLLDARGQPLLPLRATLDYLQIPVEERGDTLVLQWPPGVWSTRVDLGTRVVSSGQHAFTVPAEEWVLREREAFISPGAMAGVLGGEVAVDWENVSILLSGRTDFPVVRRAQDAARRSGGLRGGALRREAEPDVAYPARSGGWTGTWGTSADWTPEAVRGRARAALGAALFGGAIEGGASAAVGDGAVRLVDGYGRYDRALPRSRWVRRIQLGDVQSDGLLVRPFFGAAITNEPVYAPRYFGEVLVRPVVPAGWEYEVYQGDYLVGVSTQGSQEPIPTPIGYGTTPLRIRLLGPAGQERVEEVTFLVPAVQVPAGEWRYYAGAGACRQEGCSAFGYGDLRYGASTSLTLGGGVDHTSHRDSAAETHPYGILAWNPRPEMQAEVRARAGGFVHLTVQRYGSVGGWRAAAGWKRQEGFATLTEPQWYTELGNTIKLGLPGRGQLLGLGLRTRGSSPGGADAWQVSATSGYDRLQVTAAYETGFQQADVATLQTHYFVPRDRLRSFPDLNLTSRIDWAGSRLQTASVGATFRPRDRANATVSLGWNAEARRPEIALSLLARTPSAYLQSNTYSQGSRYGAFVSAGGGIAMGAGGLETSPFETMGRSGVSGRTFYDENANGTLDPGEQMAPGIPVAVGGERTRSDSTGAYRAWGVLPYGVLTLGVDTLSLTSPDVAPGQSEYLLRPTPNAYVRQDLPLLHTREAVGRVRWRGAAGALGGITVELLRDGDPGARRVLTFSDGEYYIPQLRPGRYRIGIAASSLEALRGRGEAEAITFEVPAQGTGSVELPTVWIVRR